MGGGGRYFAALVAVAFAFAAVVGAASEGDSPRAPRGSTPRQSVSFTGVAGFLLAALWFISFGIAAASFCFCKSRMGRGKVSHADVARPLLLVVVVLALIAGCIVLSYGQSEFHEEATKTLDFVVNQSDFTIQTLRNVTDYLSFAVTINVAALYLPSDVQDQINSLKVDLNKASDTISLKTTENYKRIRKVLHNVCLWEDKLGVILLSAFVGLGLEWALHCHSCYDSSAAQKMTSNAEMCDDIDSGLRCRRHRHQHGAAVVTTSTPTRGCGGDDIDTDTGLRRR